MENFINMVEIQAVLFVYLLVGLIIRKKNVVSKDSIQDFINFLVNIALPCMVFNSFDLDFTMDTLRTGGACLALSMAVCFFSYFIGKILYRNAPPQQRSILQYGTMISNAGFAGLPLVSSAYGPEALFYASIFLIPIRIFMWSAGISLFTNAPMGTKIKNVLKNPGIIAVELGIIRMLFHIPIPVVLDNALHSIGNITSALSIIIVGAILAEVNVRQVFERNVLLLSFVRLLFLPGLLLIILKAAGAPFLMTASAVCLTGMPAGATTALLAQKYGADHQFASKAVFVTTVFSLVTMPLLTVFF